MRTQWWVQAVVAFSAGIYLGGAPALASAPARDFPMGEPASATAATPRCFGQPATIVGTPRADRIGGTDGHDVIVSLGGADTVRGRGGEDFICGGDGPDVIFAGADGGFIFGNRGDDKLHGARHSFTDFAPGGGDDLVRGHAGNQDYVHFEGATQGITASLTTQRARGQGRDTLVSADALLGGRFDDTLIGNGGPDNGLAGRGGDDVLRGRGGFDFISGQAGDDVIDGGRGFDVSDYYEEVSNAGQPADRPVHVNLRTGFARGYGHDTLINIEGATGSDAADTMTGNAKDNAFFALFAGADTVRLGRGDDFVDAGAGADLMYGGPGTDQFSMVDGARDMPRPGGVTVNLSTSYDSDADTFTDFENVTGSFGDDELIGTAGRNGLFSFDGDDTVRAGGGDDLVDPGNGTDTADGGAGVDMLGNLDHYTGGMTIDLGAGSDSDNDALTAFEDALGTFDNDTIVGSGGPNMVLGTEGDDVLRGLAGADNLFANDGVDRAYGGAGVDHCQAESQRSCEYALGSRSVSPDAWRHTVSAGYLWKSVLARHSGLRP